MNDKREQISRLDTVTVSQAGARTSEITRNLSTQDSAVKEFYVAGCAQDNVVAGPSEEERDRVLSDGEIALISEALARRKEWADALFYFQISLITGGRMAEILRMRWEESSERFGTVKIYSSKTKKWRTIKAPAAAALIAERRAEGGGNKTHVLPQPDHWIRAVLREASESVDIPYGQKVPGGWCPHDLRHTCLTNLVLAGVPLNGIKEYAGHASIVETQRYLKFMPESIELAARASDRLARIAGVKSEPHRIANRSESGKGQSAKQADPEHSGRKL